MTQEEKYYLYKEKNFFQRFFGHLGTVLKHKRYVCRACFKMGRYYQGLFHDLSKFSLTEFSPSVKYYSGRLSPNAVDRKINGASLAWLHHKGRNKHHFEYWIDYSSSSDEYAFGCRMPLKYVAEMIADRYAACVAYNRDEYTQADAWNYYSRARHLIIMNKDTRAVLEKALTTMAEEGEDAAFKYMKELLKVTKGSNYTAEELGLKEVEIDTPES
ncbi:MAG: catalase [Lachnospiraceae bacterium]|nr:catalase [Lachnospiraceae bacterium]